MQWEFILGYEDEFANWAEKLICYVESHVQRS